MMTNPVIMSAQEVFTFRVIKKLGGHHFMCHGKYGEYQL